MRKLTLRTQIALMVILLQLYFLSLGLAYWVQSNAQLRLKQTFDDNVAVIVKLPQLRGDLVYLHILTRRYLLTGSKSWLDKRLSTLGHIRKLQNEMSSFKFEPAEQDIVRKMSRQFESYLTQENSWIKLKQQGKLSLQEATKIASRDSPIENLIETTS